MRIKSRTIAALALLAEIALLQAAPVIAGSYTVPPFTGYQWVTNNNGELSSTSGQFTPTNGYLCPCTGVDSSKHCLLYETSEVKEYKYESVFAGPGTVTVSYTLEVFQGILEANSGSGNVASITVSLSMYDNSGQQVGSTTILSRSVNGANGHSQYGFGSPSTFTGTTSFQSLGNGYNIRWTVDVKSQNSARSDFYFPYWMSLNAMIDTPQGQSP